ncbi:MAG: diguanylate cyclase [Myxococcota bacterium]
MASEAKKSKELLTRLERKINELSVFMEIGKALTSSLDVTEVLKVVMSKVKELLEPKTWSLLLIDEATNELFVEIVVGRATKNHVKTRIPVGAGIEGEVARDGKPVLINGPYSVMCVPLRFKGKTLGVIEVTDRTGQREFTEEEMGILGTLADYAAIAIQNARNFQRVEELTITDDLTGLYNSRHLHQLLEFEIVRSRRHRLEFSLIFMDLDYFKRVNDRYGHLMGSRLLKEVGHEIGRGLRKLDIATRYGGDEFVMLLPQTPKKEAYQVAQRIRELIEERVFLYAEGLSVRITASFGVACFPTDAAHKEDIIRLADQAMYRVKGADRNDVKMA